MQKQSSEFEYNIVVVGGGGVGKSAITSRFIKGKWVDAYDPTIEEAYQKQMEIDGKQCYIDVMDTAGQEEYSALRDQYMKKSEGIVLVFSITSKSSLDAAKKNSKKYDQSQIRYTRFSTNSSWK